MSSTWFIEMTPPTIERIASEEASDTLQLTILELRVLELAWKGKKQTEIAQIIHRDPRTVARMLRQLPEKLGPLNPTFLRLRLEDELIARIPTMSNTELIKALSLYLPPWRREPLPNIQIHEKSLAQQAREKDFYEAIFPEKTKRADGI